MPTKLSSASSVARAIFPKLGLSRTGMNHGAFWGEWGGSGEVLAKHSPIDGTLLGRVRQASPDDYDRAVQAAQTAFARWREVPAPKRGEVIRRYGAALPGRKKELGRLVQLGRGQIVGGR